VPKTDPNPILLQDIVITVLKVILASGREIVGPAQTILRVHSRSQGLYKFEVWWCDADGSHIQFGYLADGDPVAQICYQFCHMPSRYISPIYSHPFKDVTHNWGLPMSIGMLSMYPAEKVWPELCEKGWYGDLPQFYN